MPQQADVIYRYDGSLEGALCAIFESYVQKEIPLDIVSDGEAQASLYPVRRIETQSSIAKRVMAGLNRVAGSAVADQVRLAFYTCMPHREMRMLSFVRLAMRMGADVLSLLTDDTVRAVTGAVNHLTYESHQYTGFVRFSDAGGVLYGIIGPKNFVLPLLAPHFCDRYPQENLFLYDETHHVALISRQGQGFLVPIDNYTPPAPGQEEAHYRSLWKTFYHTIGIEGRYNPRCRMNHMQKRYWKHLTEMDESIPLHGPASIPADTAHSPPDAGIGAPAGRGPQ
nr:TIGR03915 family putative DNA repair protein [bacterium]